MLIPAWKAYRTSYWECVTVLAGSQTNGYSRAAIPSVEADIAQPTCTIRQISQAMKLIGQAVDPGRHLAGDDQSAARRPRLPKYLVPLQFSIRCPEVAGKAGKGFASPVIGVDFAADVESAGRYRRCW